MPSHSQPRGGLGDRHHDDQVVVNAGGRRLKVKNLDKVLYPATETTKSEVLHYYASVAPVLLPHLDGRPVTRIRYPDGVESVTFFEKRIPAGTPGWLPRVTLEHSDDSITYPLIEAVDGLIYLANLAALELHVPQWRVDGNRPVARRNHPDRLVVDLDPGAGAGLHECATVALLVRDRLAAIGLSPVPVTSGSKGLQVYAAVPGSHSSDDIATLVQAMAQELTAQHPELVVWKMTRSLRPGKVLLDWSQNVAAKTTISPYSMRGRDAPFVAAPRTWHEIEHGADDPLALAHLTIDEVLARIEHEGDLASALLPEALC